MIDENEWRSVLQVAKDGTFSQAAKHLFVSQPSLSQCIKEIERELGMQIFDRSHVPLELTEAGKVYVEAAREMQRLHQSILRRVYDAKRECCGFHAQLAAEDDVMRATGQIVDSADKAEADVLVTPCPLCQMQLDMHTPEGREAVHSRAAVPILRLQQLVGLALGLSKEEIGFNRHVTAQSKLKIG